VEATRTDIWTTAADVWAHAPVLGDGLGSFPDAYSEARISGKRFLPQTVHQPPPHAHNIFFQSLAESGLVGLLFLLALLIVATQTALAVRRSHQRWLRIMGTAALASIVAFLLHNLVDLTLFESTGTYFFGLLGLLGGLYALAKTESAVTSGRAPNEEPIELQHLP
jgi:O-antigen ligase